MSRHYTRVCNFYYGNNSKILVNKKKSIPFNGIKEISFDQIEIITRNSKKKIFVNQIKYLPKLIKRKINSDLKKIKSFAFFRFPSKLDPISAINIVLCLGPT